MKKKRLRADLHESWRNHPELPSLRSRLATEIANVAAAGKKEWSEGQSSAHFEYIGEKPITTLEEALEFCEADLSIWEVERFLFNAWDVTMKASDGGTTKRTNYQVKVWFKRVVQVIVSRPILKPIIIKPTIEAQMWIIIGCVHRPFHDKKLWDALLAFINDNSDRVHGLIINGDYLDLRSLSSYEENPPEGIDLGTEYSDGLQGIAELDQAIGDGKKKIYHYGNHEDRYNREVRQNKKYGKMLQSPEEAMELKERGYRVQTDWKDGYTLLGNSLEVFHGEYYGANPSKQHLDAMPDKDCLFNHSHRIGRYSHNKRTAYNIGWMGNPEDNVFSYKMRRAKNKWAKGFAVVYITPDGKNYVNIIDCNNSDIFFDGKIYK